MTNGQANAIVRAAIFPSIGIARVGNSMAEGKEGYLLGPEVPHPLPDPPYRDTKGALKRQAARFRIYGLDAAGKVIAELTAADAEITWTVHLANKKASWYAFELAQDIPEAASAPVQMLRNITVADRASLNIDPGPRSIRGTAVNNGPAFDTGKFVGKTVYLGELKTDEAGRLIVLGGRGFSSSYDGTKATTFANNEAWHDDISDGPVTAAVTHKGRTLAVDPAWIVVAPPNYGPMQKSVRTMWDLMRDLAFSAGMLTKPSKPSFNNEIRPIFERLSRLQWVNKGFAAAFGWQAPNNLATPEWLARLNDPTMNDQEVRHTLADQFRVFDRDAWSPVPWPWLYGDAMNLPTPQTPRAFSSLTNTQLGFLQQWSAGSYIPDYDAKDPPRRIEDYPIADQGDVLTQAALEFCLADAFHPGCEMTWPMRHPTMYMSAFRLAHADPLSHEPDYGRSFTPDLLTLPNGPFFGQRPGGISRWMAVPWQTDTASCLSGYEPEYDLFLPTFWPARVPNWVLTTTDYNIVIDTGRPLAERSAAFARRKNWLRPLGLQETYIHQINSFIGNISQMGVVEERKGPQNDPHFPALMDVEDLKTEPVALFAAEAGPPTDRSTIAKVNRFPRGLRL